MAGVHGARTHAAHAHDLQLLREMVSVLVHKHTVEGEPSDGLSGAGLVEEAQLYAVCMQELCSLVALNAPTAGAAIALGMFAFEVGSLFYNAVVIDGEMRAMPRTVWPPERVVPTLYVVCMTASNVVGGLLPPGPPLACCALNFPAGLI